MRRLVKILIVGAASSVVLLASIFAFLSAFNWNHAKPWITERVSETIGRPFSIDGDLFVQWGQGDQTQSGWRRWIPQPRLQVQQVKIGNPDWSSTGRYMASIEQLDFTLHSADLLHKKISVSSLTLTEPKLILERDEDGRNNWTFNKKKNEEENEESRWELQMHDLQLQRGMMRIADAIRRIDVTADIEAREKGKNSKLDWTVNGTLDGEKVSGKGTAGSLLSLASRNIHHVQYPVEAELHIGEAEVTASGTLTNPIHLAALDLDLKIDGASMSQFYPLTGIALSSNPKFSTEGRIVGTIGNLGKDTQLRYEKFQAKIGSSKVEGTLEYIRHSPRPLLRGDISSQRLNLGDLAVLLDPENGDEAKRKSDTGVKQPPGKVLPVASFQTEKWSNIDIKVTFSGKEIIRREGLPINDLHAEIQMDNGVLSLAPFRFGMAGGRITSDIRIDSNSDPAQATMTAAARGLKLKRLFPKVKPMQASLGEVSGEARLTATGNSVATLMASSNGEVKSLITQGSISKFVLEAMGLNIGSAVVAKMFGDRQVRLNCMANEFKVTDGLMQTRFFVVDTEDATLYVDGNISFDRESLNLTIRPDSKGLRLISLRSPLYVGGTFKNPDIGVDQEAVALKAGAAAILATVATPLAALLALINPGPGKESPCGTLLAQARKPPVVPSPAKARSKPRR